MFWGILAAAAFALCAAKYITHRIHRPEVDRLFLRLHVAGGAILPLAAGIHSVLMLKKQHRLREAVSGFCIDAGILGLLVSHFFSKQLGARALPMHRFSTVFTGVGMVSHGLTHKK